MTKDEQATPDLLDWQKVRYGDTPEARAAVAAHRQWGWPVDDPDINRFYDDMMTRIGAFKEGYRAGLEAKR